MDDNDSYGVNMNIRYGTIHDAKMLSALGAKTFFETFAKDNTPENIEAYLKVSFSPEIQFNELSNPENIFLIVESEDTPIGYTQLILNSKDDAIQRTRPLEIRRIYAAQEYLGKGVGKALMQATINEARQRGCDCVWLGVWEKNQRAIDFYKKCGFREVGTHLFSVGDDPQNDCVMELELT
jgi:ribosomal protein S18 acetylase RimI-like enzyme